MKIFFAGSIRGGRGDKELYLKLVNHLQKYGKVLLVHVADQELTELGERDIDVGGAYDRDMSCLKEADVVIAEVSTPSLGVGYELAMAEGQNKKILCLYRPREGKSLSAMISGNPRLLVKEYKTLEEALSIIDDFFA